MSGTPTPAPKDLTGKWLGRYELLARIASGGMASVYLARASGEAGFTRLVAIKVLHSHLGESADFVAMFQDEARLAARVRHPNVVDVYDVTTIDGELVLSMQYVEGASLQALRRVGKKIGTEIPIAIVIRVLVDALRGLHAAHELMDDHGEPLGLVHRDFSPHNVLVGADGLSRVTDFGVAKARGRATEETRTGVLKGKLRYLAPEQLQRAKSIDRRVDVFAAGVVLWEALTGRTLFEGEGEADILMGVLQHSIPPPSSVRPEIPLAIDRVCLRALERDPDRRYATALDFADAVEAAAGNTLARANEVATFVETQHRIELERLRSAGRRPSSLPQVVEPEVIAVAHTEAPTVVEAPPRRRLAWLIAVTAIAAIGVGSAWIWSSGSDPAPAAAPQPSLAVPPATTTIASSSPSAIVSATPPPPVISASTVRPQVIMRPTTTKPTTKPSTFVPSAL